METHGKFEITIHSQCIEITAFDSWNEECAKLAIETFKEKAKDLPPNWACLVNLEHWMLSTPETIPLIQSLQKWCIDHGQKFEATVLGDEIINAKEHQMNHYLNGIQSTVEQQYFATRIEAVNWLKSNNIEI